MSAPGSLLHFAGRLLEAEGAAVERGKGTLEVLLPPGLSSSLGLPEEVLLHEEVGPASLEGCVLLRPGSRVAASLARVAQGDGRLAALGLPASSASPHGLQRQALERFPVRGASSRAEPLRSGQMSYLLFTFMFEARGEEHLLGLVSVILSEDSGLEPPGLLQATTAWDLPWQELRNPPPPVEKLDVLFRRAVGLARSRAREQIAPMEEKSGAWLGRILHEIGRHAEQVREEVFTTIARRKLSDEEIARRETRVDELGQVLARLETRLRESATISVLLQLLGILRLRLPVLRSIYEIHRGRDGRRISLTFSPMTKAWEPVACESCGAATYALALCPGPAHLLCSGCRELVVAQGPQGCGACLKQQSSAYTKGDCLA